MKEVTALEYLEEQRALECEAAERYPWDPEACTHHMNVERQQLFACLTCRTKTGQSCALCYSCAIHCHTEHDLVELYTKRGLSCDCGTIHGGGFLCKLRGVRELEPSDNTTYKHNFAGKFCDCNSEYTDDEQSTMIQCFLGSVCQEDWYHERCVLGLSAAEEKSLRHQGTEQGQDDSESDSISMLDGLPSPDDFEAFVCWRCTEQCKLESIESAPFVVAAVKQVSESGAPAKTSLFLSGSFRDGFQGLAGSSTHIADLVSRYPFLVHPEVTYEPPYDDEAGSPLVSAAERALGRLPHENAVSGIEAYGKMRDKLESFFAPFAATGRVVTENDVATFFESLKEVT